MWRRFLSKGKTSHNYFKQKIKGLIKIAEILMILTLCAAPVIALEAEHITHFEYDVNVNILAFKNVVFSDDEDLLREYKQLRKIINNPGLFGMPSRNDNDFIRQSLIERGYSHENRTSYKKNLVKYNIEIETTPIFPPRGSTWFILKVFFNTINYANFTFQDIIDIFSDEELNNLFVEINEGIVIPRLASTEIKEIIDSFKIFYSKNHSKASEVIKKSYFVPLSREPRKMKRWEVSISPQEIIFYSDGFPSTQ
jgi:hypothetical protein